MSKELLPQKRKIERASMQLARIFVNNALRYRDHSKDRRDLSLARIVLKTHRGEEFVQRVIRLSSSDPQVVYLSKRADPRQVREGMRGLLDFYHNLPYNRRPAFTEGLVRTLPKG